VSAIFEAFPDAKVAAIRTAAPGGPDERTADDENEAGTG
jgi:hypothetical protein